MKNPLGALMDRYPERVRAVLNLLVESPYFYRTDSEDEFLFLSRHQREFGEFYQELYGWALFIDNKCARVFKEKWYNERITPSNRLFFTFTRRDECIAFMLLLEFFEIQLEENSLSVDDQFNLKFRFGDFLQHCQKRFQQLMPDKSERYTGEYIRSRILRPVMPRLLQFRFLKEIPRPTGMDLTMDDVIYETLPALYHYNARRLNQEILSGEADQNRDPDELLFMPDEDQDADAVDESEASASDEESKSETELIEEKQENE